MKNSHALATLLVCLGTAVIPAMANEHADENEEFDGMLPERDILEFVQTHLPTVTEELRELKQEDGDEYEEALEELSDRIQEYRRVRLHAPAAADALLKADTLEREAWELAERIRDTESQAARATLTTQLQASLTEIFDLRLKMPEVEIAELEQEIAEIRHEIEQRRAHRGKIIERRLKEMLGEGDELDWW